MIDDVGWDDVDIIKTALKLKIDIIIATLDVYSW